MNKQLIILALLFFTFGCKKQEAIKQAIPQVVSSNPKSPKAKISSIMVSKLEPAYGYPSGYYLTSFRGVEFLVHSIYWDKVNYPDFINGAPTIGSVTAPNPNVMVDFELDGNNMQGAFSAVVNSSGYSHSDYVAGREKYRADLALRPKREAGRGLFLSDYIGMTYVAPTMSVVRGKIIRIIDENQQPGFALADADYAYQGTVLQW